MPAPSLAQLREGLAAAMDGLHEGLSALPRGTGKECTPVVIVTPSAGPRRQVKPACGCETDFILGVYVGLGDRSAGAGIGAYEAGQIYLDELIAPAGEHSIRERLHANRSLGGIAKRVEVRGFQAYGLARFNTPDTPNTWSAQVLVTVTHECS